MRSFFANDGYSRTWCGTAPLRAIGRDAVQRIAPVFASSARRPMSVWTTIMSGPAWSTSSVVAAEAARTRPCIRPPSPPLVALYDLASGNQRWISESLFQQTEPKRGGLGGLMQGLVRAASAATTLEVLQAGPDMIVVHTL